ncbi:MAG: peptide deformylase [Gammaproteobacteria bacterium]|nr:peptide deformylase [Gammaproteobacteria bacterium]
MPARPILYFPDPRLRKKSAPVSAVDSGIRQLVDDMFETMYQAPGIGLAAPQVDVAKRVIVVDTSEEGDTPICLINPKIVASEGAVDMEEGCLSIPGIQELIERAERITVTALNRDGNAFELEADGLLSVCIQHEMDHLEGKLFVDYLSPLKRQRIRKKMEKLRRHTL